ncbi:PrsW family intramembrane metalloprotease [Patescibacteria group bacterium]|nr:PrsW family intramembrane metalloprotease [Patescibacteria group bacterium]MBU4022836.1 PrsW family intramembrane metalloprotease [Patescibacteria group bacterium]
MLYYPFLAILGLIPSTLWLLFYLRKDTRPEPNRMVILVFLLGMLSTFPAALIEMVFKKGCILANLAPHIAIIVYFLIGVAITEEVLKYLVVRFSALKTKEFDEPIDAMIYMIIAGLGFAAVENILTLWALKPPMLVEKTTIALLGRFIGATFLHALAGANIGFFIALSFFRTRHRKMLLFAGIFGSVVLHGIYNIGITMEGGYRIAIVGTILLLLFLLVLVEFSEIKKLLTVCRIKLTR